MQATTLAVVLLLVSGCSAIKIAYNQADRMAAWTANDAFDLGGEQKDALRAYLERFHAWHRATQLPEYARLLATAQNRLHAGVAPADAEWLIEAYRTRKRVMVLQAHADAARLLATLSDAQVAVVRKDFEKRNRNYAQDHGVGEPPEEQLRLRAKRHLERIEHWSGPLSSAQAARAEAQSRALPLVTDLRLQDRQRRQHEFLALLEERHDFAAFAPKLRDWLLDWDRNRTPEHQAQFTRFTEASIGMYLESIAGLTSRQRDHAAARMQRYVEAFRELAAEAPQGPSLAGGA